LGTCSICHRISGTGEDHLDCIEKRRVDLEDEELKRGLPARLDADPQDLGIEIKAILEHIARESGTFPRVRPSQDRDE
jgi:hypothetical protein